jgi:hypothetical protein
VATVNKSSGASELPGGIVVTILDKFLQYLNVLLDPPGQNVNCRAAVDEGQLAGSQVKKRNLV